MFNKEGPIIEYQLYGAKHGRLSNGIHDLNDPILSKEVVFDFGFILGTRIMCSVSVVIAHFPCEFIGDW